MAKLPTYQTIAGDLDAQCSYLMRRCLIAEGHDPDDADAMRGLLKDVQEACPYTRR